ncbi:hypothetical protein [Haloarcula montana]|nr:hypothetical protein [Haloarcula sp. GH36]
MSNSTADGTLPWFVKVVMVVALLVVLFIIGVDLLTFAGSL